MYQVRICQSVSGTGSVIVTETLGVFYEETYPDNPQALLEEYGGDYIDIVYEEGEDDFKED